MHWLQSHLEVQCLDPPVSLMHGILWHTSSGSQCRQRRIMPHLHIFYLTCWQEWLIFTSTYWSSRTVASETRARDWSGWIYSFLFIYLLWIQSCIVIIIILDVHMIRGDGNLFSPLVFTFRLSVLLSSPELRRQVVPNIVRCGPRAVLSPALLSCYRVSAQEIQLHNTCCSNAVILYWSLLLNECASFQLRSNEETRENVIYIRLKD